MSRLAGIRDRYLVKADPLRTQRRIELLALLAALALCLQLTVGGLRLATLGAPEVVEPAADSMRLPMVLSPLVVAAGERSEIVERPLFWSGRRPPEAAATTAEAAPRKGKAREFRNVKQVGVFGSGDQAGIIALVKGKKRRILLGETLNGWTLDAIHPTESEFVDGGQREVLKLRRGKVTAPVQQDVKAAPASGPTTKKAPAAAPPEVPPESTTARQESGLGLGQREWGGKKKQ